MKKLATLVVLLVLIPGLVGCGASAQYDIECYVYDQDRPIMIVERELIPLSNKDKQYIAEVLENATWKTGTCRCGYHVICYVDGEELMYSSSGIFNDLKNKQRIDLTDEQHEKINKMFGLGYTKETGLTFRFDLNE